MSKYEDDYEEGEYLAEDGEINYQSVKPSSKKLQQDEVSEMSDTQDSLDIRPPQASIRNKDRLKRSRPERIRFEEERMERRQRKDAHRKGHHRQREHHRGEHGGREKRHHRERREGKERDRERTHAERREHKRRVEGPPPLMSLSTPHNPHIEDLRTHLERRDKGERRSDGGKEHHRERREKVLEEPPEKKPPPETPQQKEERLQKERRIERFLHAEREREKMKEISRREMEMRKSRKDKDPENELGDRDRSRSQERIRHRNEDGPPKGGVPEEILVSGSDDEEESQEEGEDNDQSEEESSDENDEEESSAESESGSGSSTESDSTESDEEESDSKGNGIEIIKKVPVEQAILINDSDKEDDENAIENTPPRSDVDVVEEEDDPMASLPLYLPAIQGCRNVEEFQCLNRIEEGTYGVVYRARDKRTEEIVALKRLKMEKEKEGFPITSLREINTLLKAQHPNIVTVREIVVGSNMDKIFIVMDYVEHDLKSLMETMKQKKQVFLPGEIKCLMEQLLKAVTHLHDNWILHRDLKTSNLLLSHRGILKVGDFGLAREYGSPLKAYTSIVVTLWYRAPELLLGIKEYSTPIDVWSVGCIFGELLLMEALFPGKSEIDQLNKIFKALGTPTEKIWPGYKKLPNVQKLAFTEYPVSHLRTRFATTLSEKGFELMNNFLTFDPAKRITAEAALKHEYFDETPCAIDPAMFPTWPAKSELGHKKAAASPKPPSGGREYKDLVNIVRNQDHYLNYLDDSIQGDGEEELHAAGRGLFEARKSVIGAGFNLRFFN